MQVGTVFWRVRFLAFYLVSLIFFMHSLRVHAFGFWMVHFGMCLLRNINYMFVGFLPDDLKFSILDNFQSLFVAANRGSRKANVTGVLSKMCWLPYSMSALLQPNLSTIAKTESESSLSLFSARFMNLSCKRPFIVNDRDEACCCIDELFMYWVSNLF